MLKTPDFMAYMHPTIPNTPTLGHAEAPAQGCFYYWWHYRTDVK